MTTWVRSNHIRMAGASEGLALGLVMCGALRQKVCAGLWRVLEEFVPVLATGELMRPMPLAPRVTFLTFSNRRISEGSQTAWERFLVKWASAVNDFSFHPHHLHQLPHPWRSLTAVQPIEQAQLLLRESGSRESGSDSSKASPISEVSSVSRPNSQSTSRVHG
jgi:hypothetical protein